MDIIRSGSCDYESGASLIVPGLLDSSYGRGCGYYLLRQRERCPAMPGRSRIRQTGEKKQKVDLPGGFAG